MNDDRLYLVDAVEEIESLENWNEELEKKNDELSDELENANDRIIELEQEIKDITN